MSKIRMGSLFDGSAGFPLAAVMNGIEAVWASEIEPYPIRVTTKRLPFMKHYGDISAMHGSKIEEVDIITGGSPCQDMSIAGKRAGLDGERSGLFREQIRIIKEMREVTNGRYPRYMVWENVPGALSSNKGQDFRCVLEETARIKEPNFTVPAPEKDKWSTAGLIMGENFSIAWRILDAQYWGVPQRRRRIFLVADFSGTSAGEILFKREGLSWHFTQSRETWQTATGSLKTGTDETGRNPIYSIDREAMSAGYEFDRKPGIDESETAYTLKATGPGGVAYPTNYLFENHSQDTRYTVPLDVAQTVSATYGMGGNNQPFVVENQIPMTMQIRCGCEGGGKGALIQENKSATLSTHNTQTLFCMATQQGGAEIAENLSPTITAAAGMSGNNQPIINQPIPIQDQAISNGSGNGNGISEPDEPMYTLMAETHHGVAYSLQGNMIGRSDKNGPQGSGINEDVSFTLNTTDQHAVCTEVYHCASEIEKSPILKARDYKDPHVVAFDRAYFNQGQNAQYDPQFFEDGTVPTLVARGPSGVCHGTYWNGDQVAGTLSCRNAGGQQRMPDKDHFQAIIQNYIVRRLTPLECARLQGFPDWWTANLGTKEEDITEEMMTFWRNVFETHRKIVTGASKPKTDKQIKKWLMDPDSDSAEYKMWGNGVALPCVLYVMEGIADELRKE